jgi:replicative DNA helicase
MSQLIDSPIASPFDRLPPHSIEAEQGLLGSLLRMDFAGSIDKARLAKVRQIIRGDSFFQADHQIVFDELMRQLDAGDFTNASTLAEGLKGRQLLEEVGGYAYLTQIIDYVPHSVGAEAYAKIIRQKSMLRGVISLANDAIRSAYGPTDGEEAAESMAMELSSKAARLATAGKATAVYSLGDVAQEVYESLEAGTSSRIPTGLGMLDQLIGGLRIGGKVIIGAKPGMGKSLLLKQIGLNLSRRGVKFGIISVEESRHKIAENAISNASGVPNNRIAYGNGKLTNEDWQSLTNGVGSLIDLPFKIIDSARTISSITAAARLLQAEYGCEVIACDHLHIIDGETNEHREREIAKISAELKWTWKDLNVAGIECAQLNRGGGKDRPTLASLRDSGSLEQDADVVILLHREDYYRASGEQEDHVVELIVLKNKDGAPGMIPCHYDGARQRVADLVTDQYGSSAAPVDTAPRAVVLKPEDKKELDHALCNRWPKKFSAADLAFWFDQLKTFPMADIIEMLTRFKNSNRPTPRVPQIVALLRGGVRNA